MGRQRTTDPYRSGLNRRRAKAYHRLVKLLRQPTRTLPDYLACGRALAALQPAGAGYGSGWVNDARGALERHGVRLSRPLAYRLLRFAPLYPGGEGAAQVRRLDNQISWEVMYQVISVEDEQTRDAILRRAAEEGLSSRAVIGLVQEAAGYRRGSRGRLAPAGEASTHPHRALRQLRALAARWPAVNAAWAGGRDGALLRAGRLRPAEVTDAFLADLEAVVPMLGEMARTAGDLAARLSRLLPELRSGRS